MDGGIHFDVTADDANFQAKISAIKQGVSDASKLMENAFRAAQSSSDKSTKSIEGNFLKMSDSMEELPKIINDQKNAISQLEKQYKKVQDSFNKLSPSKAKAVLGEEMNSIKKTIDEEKEALRQLVEKQKEYNQSNISVRTQMTNVRNEMTQLELAGQKNSARYRELEQELGRLGTAYRKIQYEQQALSTGATQWGGIISGIQGLSGAFAAAQGVIGLFVTDNKELAKIQTRLQAVMAITIGMQQVSNTLHETSAFRMTTVRRVTELYAAAQTKLATSLGISAVAAKVLMASLTLGLSVAITAIIALISKWSSSQKKAAEEQRHIIEVQKKFLDTTSGQIAVYEKLRKGWNDLGNNLAAKKKFITENADEFKKLGIAISGVKDAENLLVKNRDAFLESLNQRAMAAASMELATEKYKEVLKKKLELSSTSKTKTETRTYGSSVTGGMRTESYEVENKEYTRLEKEIEIAQKSADSFIQKNIESISKSNEILAKAGLNTITQSEQAENEAEKRRKLQEKLDSELLAIQKQNQEDEIDLMEEGTDKKLAQIEHDFEEQKKKIKEKAAELAKLNKELGIKGVNGNGLTSGQQEEIDEANRLNEENRKKSESEVYKSEIASMRDYLKEYGTFQQKKLAIAEEYAEKIKKAQNEGERLKFEKERDSSIRQVDIDALKQNIDWATVFGEFGGMFSDIIKPALVEAKKYRDSDEFKNLDQSSQKDLIDAINQMEKSIGQSGKISFKKLGEDIQAYQQSLNELNNAKQAEIKAIEDLKKAQETYNKAIKEGTEQEKNAAKQALENAKNNANAASENVHTQERITKNSQQTVSDSATKLRANMDNVTEGLSKLASGGLRSAYDGIIQAGKGIGGAIGKISESLESVPIVGWIISIIDVLKDGLSNLLGGLIDAIFNAASGVLTDILTGDFAVTVLKSLRDGIGKMLNAFTFGGWNSWMSSSNAKEVAEITERLTSSNERLKDSVDKLKDEMSKTGGWKAIDAAQQAKKDQEQINQQSLEILMAQMGYHGAHHSNAYYWNLNKSDYASLNQSLANYAKKNPDIKNSINSVGSLEDIYKLTPEQLDYIRTYNIEMWEKMISQGKYDKAEYWEQYADLSGQLEEIEESLKETLTQISFDSLRSSFIDALMDMDKSAEDFSDDFSEYMMKAILNARISDMLDKDLEEFYDKWAKYQETGNKMEDWELEELKKMWDDITQKGIQVRDEIASITGYGSSSSSYSQEASSKGFQAMSQDVGEELNGRFTALQISNEEIKNQMLNVVSHLSMMASVSTENNAVLNDMLFQQVLSNGYLEDIARHTKLLNSMKTTLEKVRDNTGRL